ncbi:MAG: NAD-dependent epimerase [Flavobacteriaceae bacterium]|nr:MAG: NAD-dependent epimerase [Flavobacteriaceae bacterium]
MILVTGGTGLVGAHLLVALTKENEKVRAIHRKSSNIKDVKKVFSYYFDDITPYFSKIEWMEADITDTPSLKKPFLGIDFVYHCAAIISFHPKAYHKMRKVNIEGTANIVNFSIAQNVKKLCFVSSVAAVGKSLKNNPIDEDCEWTVENSNYGYAITKYGAEMEVWRGTQEGLDAVIVNPGIIFGAGFFDSGSGSMFKTVNKGLKFYTEGVTGYVDVKDVVKVMQQLMNSNIKNERYLLVSENLSFKEVFSQMANAFEKKPPNIKVSKLMSEILWRISSVITAITGKKPILTKHSAQSIHKNNQFSNAKIKEAIGIEFIPVSETIKRVCKEFKR